MKKTPFECQSNDNLIVVHDGRADGDGVELWFGHEAKPGQWIVVGLEDLQAALHKAGISPLWRPPGDHARHGRREPYTQRGIGRMPCFRCGKPSSFQWSICADGNLQRPLCPTCDFDLNTHVLQWAGDPEADQKVVTYVRRFIRPEHVFDTDP